MKHILRYSLLFLLILSMFPISACSTSDNGTPTTTPPVTTTSAVTNGRNIYFNATSAYGERITYTGGPGMMILACANCHGSEGHGGTINLMMQSFDVPNITWPELTGQHTTHPPFTVETVKQAITQGVDPAGHPLEYPMPIWQMSANSLSDLVAFLQTLR